MRQSARSAAAEATDVVWGQPVDGLRLGLTTESNIVGLHLQNVGNATLEVLSHVATHELHLDWYTLRVEAPDGTTRTIALYDDRNRSAVIQATLAPGASLQHRVDAVAWAARRANGGHALLPGTYHLSAAYDAPKRDDTWAGRIAAGPVAWTLAPTSGESVSA